MPARSTALMCTNTSLLPSLGWMNPKPFCVLKNFTVPVAIMASLDCNAFVSDHASIAWPVIQFWGSWLGTVKRERREADRKLVAGCYLCDRGRNVNPDAGINPALLHWVIGALVEALNGIAIEGLLSRSLRLGARMQVVDAPDAESDCRDILCTGVAVFRGTSNPQGCPVVCFSSGGASAASRSAFRRPPLSPLALVFCSLRRGPAIC